MIKRVKQIVIGFILGASIDAKACVVTYNPVAVLKSQSGLVIEATILSSAVAQGSSSWRRFTYLTEIHSVEEGDAQKGLFNVKFDLALTHKRGDLTVCPLQKGTGIEHQLTVKQRYKLYILSVQNPQLLVAKVL